MKLVVGLGNPGRKYVGTRHNVGFEVIAELAKRYNVGRPKAKFDAELAEAQIGTEKTILVSPLTFMNLSGRSVQPLVDFYKLPCQDVLVICDDFSLDLARLRIRPSGSAGGQKGLNDIIQRLGTKDVPRLRLGIGKPPPQWDISNYVLGKFDKDDLPLIETAVKRAADAAEKWVVDGIQSAMNTYNPDPNAKPKPKKQKTSGSKKESDTPVDNDNSKDEPGAERSQLKEN